MILFCLEKMKLKSRLVKMIFEKKKKIYKLVHYIDMSKENKNCTDLIIPDDSMKRILDASQKDIIGIHYTPLLVSEESDEYIYLVLADIDDTVQSKQLLFLYVRLSVYGYYRIENAENVLAYSSDDQNK